MIIFRKAAALSEFLSNQIQTGFKIGFVPTMGALHSGHLSLIEAAKNENDLVVCTIFVNPIQFNNNEDFVKYPNTIEKDIELLETGGCNVLLLPAVEEMYPSTYVTRHYDLGTLENLLEGAHRPGHFQGVCQVVDRLLDIVKPHNLYIGQKDYQQCLVIKKLIQISARQTTIHIIPTKREVSGLAMSSRNLRLTETQKDKASLINNVLEQIKEHIHTKEIEKLEEGATQKLIDAGFIVDYVSIAHGETLQPSNNPNDPLVALIAATLDGVRLIDNEVLNSTPKLQ